MAHALCFLATPIPCYNANIRTKQVVVTISRPATRGSGAQKPCQTFDYLLSTTLALFQAESRIPEERALLYGPFCSPAASGENRTRQSSVSTTLARSGSPD